MEYSASWATAEQVIYARLLTAAGSVDKVDAFLGYLPNALYNVWMFKSGGAGSAQHTHNAAITSMWFGASIYGLFHERANAQAFCMKIVQILPIKDTSNIQMFRFTSAGVPSCELKAFPVSNNQNEMVILCEVQMAFDLVFTTEGSYGDTTPLAPKNFAATQGLYTDKVTLTWTASVGATGYEIWRATSNDVAEAALLTSPAAVVTYNDTTVVADTTYYYWIKATNASGKSVYSSAVSGHSTTS